MNEELLKAIAEMQALAKQYREALAKGEQSGEQKEKLAKMEKDMDTLEEKVAKLQAAAQRPEPSSTPQKDKDAKELEAANRRKELFFKILTKGESNLTDAERAEAKTMVLADETSLGYLAPPEFVADIIKNVVQFSPIRGLASQRTITSRELQRPKRDTTLSASWIGETGLPTETKKKHGMLKIPVHKLGALAIVSRDSLEDISFLESDLRAEFAEQFGVSEGAAFLTGNGVEKPMGILSDTSIGVVTTEVTAKLDFDDLINIQHELKEPYWPNASWAFNRSILKNVRKLKDENGQYLWEPAVAIGSPATILGKPYTLCLDLADIATNAKPVIYGDFRKGYQIVDRRELDVQVLREKYVPEIGYLATKRVGGQVILPEALKILKVK